MTIQNAFGNKLYTGATNGVVLDGATTGDIFYTNVNGRLIRLPVGTSGQVLSVASGVPSWINISLGSAQSVATNAAKLALTGLTPGDSLVRVLADESRNNKASSYILTANPASVETNWLLVSDEQVDGADIVTGTIPIARLPVGSNGQVLTTVSGAATWQTPSGGSGVTITTVTTTSHTLVANSIVFVNNAALCTLTLPATAAIGDSVELIGIGAGGWKVAQGAGQQIRWLEQVTTVGASGSLSSFGAENARACCKLRCHTANSGWIVTGDASGTLDLV